MNIMDREIRDLMRRASQEIILPRFRNLSSEQIIEKAQDDLITIADKEAEALIAEGLHRLDGGIAIVGEEACHADPGLADHLAHQCWIIDPLDGTHNFAHGRAPFGIIIARSEGGICQSGWIYDCLSGRFCHAHRGQGAFVDGHRVAARTTGAQMPIAAISMIFLNPRERELVNRNIAPHYNLVDIPRCAAEQYPRLALGINDVSSFQRVLAWDHAAGDLWLNEAGGKSARLDGSQYRVDDHGRPGLIAAASPQIWDEFAHYALQLGK